MYSLTQLPLGIVVLWVGHQDTQRAQKAPPLNVGRYGWMHGSHQNRSMEAKFVHPKPYAEILAVPKLNKSTLQIIHCPFLARLVLHHVVTSGVS